MKPTLALILLAAAAGTAAAQPPTTEPVGGVTEPPQPPEPPKPPQPPQPPNGGGNDTGGGDAPSGRPEGISFGVGIGYTLPTSIQSPNTTSVRMRLSSGLTIEPIIVLGNETQKQSQGATDSKDSNTEFTLAGLVRLPVVRHRKIELELLGALGFGTVKDNPDGADNNTTTSTVGLSWGLAVSYWITRHWNLTFSARNPLVSYSKSSRQMPAPAMETETTTTTVGLEFAPVVSAMIHLYN